MINPQDLRDLADFLEDRPLLCKAIFTHTLNAFPDITEWQALLTELGSFEKAESGDLFLIARKRFGRMRIEVNVNKKDTCQRVQVGTTTVQRHVYPADVQPTVETVEEPIYEWVCPDTWKDRV